MLLGGREGGAFIFPVTDTLCLPLPIGQRAAHKTGTNNWTYEQTQTLQ